MLFFIIKFVFLSFPFLFLMKYQIFATVNQSETGIGAQNLSAEFYEHDSFRNSWRCRTLIANSTQRYFKYCYKKEVLHNSKTFSSLFLDWNIFARNICHKVDESCIFSYIRVYTISYLYFDFLQEKCKERFVFTVLDLQ